MAIDDTLLKNYVKQYNANARMLVMQMDHRLAGTYMRETLVGEEGFVEQIGATSLKQKTSRFQLKEQSDVVSDRRKYVTDYFYWWKMFDKEDQVKMLMDPTKNWMLSAKASVNQKFDDVLIAAALGNAYTGKDGTTTVALPATQKVAAGGTGFTLDKLLSALEIFNGNDVDPDVEKYLLVSADAMTKALNLAEIKSSDYNTVKALVNGKIDTFLGFKWIMTNRLPLSSSTRSLIAYTKDAVALAVAEDVNTDIYQDRRYVGNPWAADINFQIGAARLEEKKVVQIDIVES